MAWLDLLLSPVIGSSTKTSYFVRSTLSETKSGPSNRLKGFSKLWFRSWLPDDSQDFLQKLFSLDISCSLSGQRTRRTKSMLGSSGILHRPLCFLGYQQYHGKGGESLPPNEKQGGEETDLDDEIFIWAPFFFGRDSPGILTPIIGQIFRRPAWLEISAILALALLSHLMTIWWGLTFQRARLLCNLSHGLGLDCLDGLNGLHDLGLHDGHPLLL